MPDSPSGRECSVRIGQHRQRAKLGDIKAFGKVASADGAFFGVKGQIPPFESRRMCSA